MTSDAMGVAFRRGLIHLYDYDAASGQVIGERIREGELGCDIKLWEHSYEAFVQQPAYVTFLRPIRRIGLVCQHAPQRDQAHQR